MKMAGLKKEINYQKSIVKPRLEVVPFPLRKLRDLQEVISSIQKKQEAELIRFRTCCADPRASK